jgi:hypothetical protein
MLKLISLILLAAPLAADPIDDLRAVLQKYPAKSKFAASATFNITQNAQEKAANAQNGATTFDIEAGSTGLEIRVPQAALDTAASEEGVKKRDPKSATPTRTAMAALALFDVVDSIDSGSMLLNDLDQATVVSSKASPLNGTPATLLQVKVKPTLIPTRFVKEPKIELKVWIGSDGVPIAAERDSNFSASVMIVSASNVRKEHWDFAVAGDRLYATKSEEENKVSAVGKSAVTKKSVRVTPKG